MSDSSAHSSGGLLTSVRLASIEQGLRPAGGNPCRLGAPFQRRRPRRAGDAPGGGGPDGSRFPRSVGRAGFASRRRQLLARAPEQPLLSVVVLPGQAVGWYSPKTSRIAPQTSPIEQESLSARRIGGSRFSSPRQAARSSY